MLAAGSEPGGADENWRVGGRVRGSRRPAGSSRHACARRRSSRHCTDLVEEEDVAGNMFARDAPQRRMGQQVVEGAGVG